MSYTSLHNDITTMNSVSHFDVFSVRNAVYTDLEDFAIIGIHV